MLTGCSQMSAAVARVLPAGHFAQMKKALKALGLLSGLLASAGAAAQTNWFTVVGDPFDAAVTTVQVSPLPVSVNGVQRVMKVRVNRSALHLNSDGLAHRSYASDVLFDCGKNTARFVSATFYRQPLWAGEPLRRETYAKGDNRPMRFKDIEPNPATRILQAACHTDTARGG